MVYLFLSYSTAKHWWLCWWSWWTGGSDFTQEAQEIQHLGVPPWGSLLTNSRGTHTENCSKEGWRWNQKLQGRKTCWTEWQSSDLVDVKWNKVSTIGSPSKAIRLCPRDQYCIREGVFICGWYCYCKKKLSNPRSCKWAAFPSQESHNYHVRTENKVTITGLVFRQFKLTCSFVIILLVLHFKKCLNTIFLHVKFTFT